MKKLSIKKSKKTVVAQTKPSSLGDVLRSRSKLGSHDLKDVWHDQKKLGKLEQKKFELKTRKITKQVTKLTKFTKKRSKLIYKFKLEPKLKNKKLASSTVIAILIIGAGYLLFIPKSKENQTDLLGVTSSQSQNGNVAQQELPKVSKTEFDLIWPAGKTQESFDVVKVSPPNNDPTYAYVDRVSGVDIKISQQKKPASFNTESDTKLKELADSFQATNVIQIDSNKIYHGYSEKTKVQSLLFIKNDILVFIASPQLFPDETWAGYILSLN